MDIVKLGIELITKQFGGNVSEEKAGSALLGLLGNGSGELDIAGLVSKFAGTGAIASVVSSWLGDGANKGINAAQILEMFGSGKVSDFANTLGVDTATAASGLSNVLPTLIDKSSSGGNVLDSVGGIGGALDMAKKFF